LVSAHDQPPVRGKQVSANVLDSHTHIVAANPSTYPLVTTLRDENTTWYLDRDVTVESLLAELDGAGVGGAVLVQAVSAHGYENRYVADAARALSERTVGVGAVNAFAANPSEDVRAAVVSSGLRGIRIFDQEPRFLEVPTALSIAQVVSELQVPLLIVSRHDRLFRLESLLSDVAGLTLIIDHCGFPDFRERSMWDALGEVLQLTEYSGVRLKVTASTLGSLLPEQLAEFGAGLAERVGADRLMWGSNFPRTHDRPYGVLVDEARVVASGMRSKDAAMFLSGTALDLWPELEHAI
jgi:L-fuconolactonase